MKLLPVLPEPRALPSRDPSKLLLELFPPLRELARTLVRTEVIRLPLDELFIPPPRRELSRDAVPEEL